MIRTKGLTKRYGGQTVLSDIDLHVLRGERVAVLGLNGAGKTTLVRCLLGLTRFEGRVDIAGHDVCADARSARVRIGYVPQRPPHLDGTLHEFVEFFSRLRGLNPAAVRARLERLNLSPAVHGDKSLGALSGGMLQKLLLALALGSDVPLLLLDEPTANLDAHARRDFLRALQTADPDTTILLATHRLADVQAVAARIVVLHDGRVAFDGSKRELFERFGSCATLWLRVPDRLRAAARAHLRSRFRESALINNGAAVGLQVANEQRAQALATLRNAGIPVEDVWTDPPTLQQLLEPVFGKSQDEARNGS